MPTNDTRETKGNSRRKLWIVAAIALGILEVKPYEYADWQSQVFFLNTSGYYAIRATAMSIEWWGAATFWTVNYNNGKPEAGYSLERAYIWRMEKLS